MDADTRKYLLRVGDAIQDIRHGRTHIATSRKRRKKLHYRVYSSRSGVYNAYLIVLILLVAAYEMPGNDANGSRSALHPDGSPSNITFLCGCDLVTST